MNNCKNSTSLLVLTLAMAAVVMPAGAVPSPNPPLAAGVSINSLTVPDEPIPVNTTFNVTMTTTDASSTFIDWFETDPLITLNIEIAPQVWQGSHSYDRPGFHQFMSWATNGPTTVQMISDIVVVYDPNAASITGQGRNGQR